MRERAAEHEKGAEKMNRGKRQKEEGERAAGTTKRTTGKTERTRCRSTKACIRGTTAKRKTGKRGEEKQGKEIVSNYGGLFEGGGKYDTIGVWKEK